MKIIANNINNQKLVSKRNEFFYCLINLRFNILTTKIPKTRITKPISGNNFR